MLLEAMALDREVAALVSHRGTLDAFRSSILAAAGGSVVAAWERDGNSVAALEQLPPRVAERVTAGLLGEGAIATTDRLQVARDCIERIERHGRRLQARDALAKLRDAEQRGDETTYREQLKRHNELLRGDEVEGG